MFDQRRIMLEYRRCYGEKYGQPAQQVLCPALRILREMSLREAVADRVNYLSMLRQDEVIQTSDLLQRQCEFSPPSPTSN